MIWMRPWLTAWSSVFNCWPSNFDPLEERPASMSISGTVGASLANSPKPIIKSIPHEVSCVVDKGDASSTLRRAGMSMGSALLRSI